MSVVNGQLANQTTFNQAFMSRLAPTTSTVSAVKLENPASGATIDSAQTAINKAFDTVGILNETDATAKQYATENYIEDGDSHKTAIEKFDVALDDLQAEVTALDAREASNNSNQADELQDHEDRITTIESEDSTFGGNKTFSGDVAIAGNLEVTGTLTSVNSVDLEVADANVVVNKGGTDLSSEGAGITVDRVTTDAGVLFDSSLASKWKVGLIGSLHEVIVSGVAQAIAGLKTFMSGIKTDTIDETTLNAGVTVETVLIKDGLVDGRDVANDGTTLDTAVTNIADHETRIDTLEANNSEDVTIAAFDTAADAKGLSVSDQAVKLHAADETHPGGVSIGTQDFGGDKTFKGDVTLDQGLAFAITTDAATTGALVALTLPATSILRLTNVGLISIQTIIASAVAASKILINDTGIDIIIKNEVGTTAADRILTGTGADFTFKNGASIQVVYDTTAARNRLVGADAAGAGAATATYTHGFYLNGEYTMGAVPSLGVDGFTVFPFAAKIVNVFMFAEVAGTAGTTELDVLVKPFGSGAFTSIFTTTPKIAYNAAANTWIGVGDTVTNATAPVLSSSPFNVAAKTAMRCDLLAKQTGSPLNCGLIVVYEAQ